MNFLTGRLAISGGGARFEGDRDLNLPLDVRPPGSSGQPVVLGVRPEHLTLGESGIDAEVEVVEPTGSEIQVNSRAANGDEIVAVFRERRMFEPGEKIRLMPQPGTVHLFDQATGARLQ